MKYRDVVIFSGHKFKVPQNIQRIDHLATHGWQLRYGGTKLFSDHTSDGSGARAALEKATKELLRRINTLPAPSLLQRGPSANKSSQLPPGITGPVVRTRRGGRTRDCSLMVLIPRFGDKPRRRTCVFCQSAGLGCPYPAFPWTAGGLPGRRLCHRRPR